MKSAPSRRGASGHAILADQQTICVQSYADECRRRGIRLPNPALLTIDNPWMGTPLLAGGHLIGAMAVWRAERPFDDEEVATLETLAYQIAVTLENASPFIARHDSSPRPTR